MNVQRLIEEAVELGMREAAVKPETALKQNLALFINEESMMKRMILVAANRTLAKAERLAHATASRQEENPSTELPRVDDVIEVVGQSTLQLLPECGAFEVYVMSAVPGYGPLMYDIAMSYANSKGHGLMSSRDSTKPAARKVWVYYYVNRPDVKAVPLVKDPKAHIGATKQSGDACAFFDTEHGAGMEDKNEVMALNMKYYANSPVDYSALAENGNVLLGKLQDMGYDVSGNVGLYAVGKFFDRLYAKSPNR